MALATIPRQSSPAGEFTRPQAAAHSGFWLQGEPFVWVCGAALTLTLLITLTLIGVVMVKGLGTFWPRRVAQLTLKEGGAVLGEIHREQINPDTLLPRLQLKIGNRDVYGLDFRWIDSGDVSEVTYPENAVAVERTENGNFYGHLLRVEVGSKSGESAMEALRRARAELRPRIERREEMRRSLSALSLEREQVRLEQLKLDYRGIPPTAESQQELARRLDEIDRRFEIMNQANAAFAAELRREVAILQTAEGQEMSLPLVDIVRIYQPNVMTLGSKIAFYGSKVVELLTAKPREANTEGGLAPAIFGTVMMVLLMSLFCIPLGVIAAIYLREYAREGLVLRLVRIAVGNLAGVPSIVYGIFGLGFFVYGLGASIDRMFFPERLPAPTFGTGGMLWASLTLALLTVPVVIVATEEALAAVPRGIREGSLALGATKFQTLTRILLPMASPGIMTGLILAMARAAGEVAPLMLVGVVKLAPDLPLDGRFPFLHLERKFMHLGFHIYDVGFQSPNVEAAKPMVYVTTLLLVGIVVLMSSVAIHLRNRMRRRFTTGAF